MEKPSFGENYRKDLAEDLKTLRNEGDKEGAEKVLEEEKETTRYQVTADEHLSDKVAEKEKIILRNRAKEYEEILLKKVGEIDDEEILNQYEITPEEILKLKEIKEFIETLEDEPPKVEFMLPGDINFESFDDSIYNKSKRLPVCITNLETVFLEYKSMGEPVIFNPSTDHDYQEWLVKNKMGMSEISIFDYLHKIIKDDYYLPGIEYEAYLRDNKNNIPESIKDGNWYYYPGMVFHGEARFGQWDGSAWDGDGYGIADDYWTATSRVVLFPKPKKEDRE